MKLVAFLGPSLGEREARRLAPGLRVLPPAGRGDLFRALRRERPRAIALLDGVFEARPAVWHREILAALEDGVAVFGASSMGALRAAELWSFGMVGIGQVYRWLREGKILDDSEVALLHADREHAYRPLTVPLVNVRWAAEAARVAKVLSGPQARTLVAAGAQIFYQERTWPRLLAGLRWSAEVQAAFGRFMQANQPDVKADDARVCLATAAAFVRQAVAGPRAVPRWPLASPLVRTQLGDRRLTGDQPLLAAVARSLGLRASSAELAVEGGTMREREEAALAARLRRDGDRLFSGVDLPEALRSVRRSGSKPS